MAGFLTLSATHTLMYWENALPRNLRGGREEGREGGREGGRGGREGGRKGREGGREGGLTPFQKGKPFLTVLYVIDIAWQ